MVPLHSKAVDPRGQAALSVDALPDELRDLATAAAELGGRAWVVGGWVRDGLLGRASKDIDVEILGLSPQDLVRALRRAGPFIRVGRSFDVYKLRARDGEIDVSMPEAEPSPAGDPLERFQAAARRRDLTINAIGLDPLTGALADPYGGQADLRGHLLRAVDQKTFLQDPLRALRVVQFAARFGFAVDPALEALCRAAPLDGLPEERVALELEKLLLKAEAPSVGLRLGRRLGIWAKVAPEVALADPDPTDLAVDRAATRRHALGGPPRPLALALGALLHGLPLPAAEAALERLRSLRTDRYPLRARVLGALGAWRGIASPPDDAALRALAETEEVVLVCELAWAITGDAHALAARARAEAMGVGYTPLPPLLYGRDLVGLGIVPGPALGALLSQVRAAQIQGTVSDSEGALALARALHAPPAR